MPEVGRWIVDGRLSFDTFCVASHVPAVFEAYARILHPAWSPEGRPVRWDAVAAWSGRTAHRLAQWELVSARKAPVGAPCPFRDAPDVGGLPMDALVSLLDLVLGHTTTPQHGFAGVWEGYGWIPDRGAGLPVLDLDKRAYYVHEGPIADLPEMGWWPAVARTAPREPPTLIWPADRTWLIAGDVDLDSTYIGGSGALVQDLAALPGIESWSVDPADATSILSDAINGPVSPSG